MYRWTLAPNHQHQSKRRLQGTCSRSSRSWPTSCTCLSCWGEMGKCWLSCVCWDWSCVCVHVLHLSLTMLCPLAAEVPDQTAGAAAGCSAQLEGQGGSQGTDGRGLQQMLPGQCLLCKACIHSLLQRRVCLSSTPPLEEGALSIEHAGIDGPPGFGDHAVGARQVPAVLQHQVRRSLSGHHLRDGRGHGRKTKILSELEGLSGCAEHHLAGLKAAKTRCSALLD